MQIIHLNKSYPIESADTSLYQTCKQPMSIKNMSNITDKLMYKDTKFVKNSV